VTIYDLKPRFQALLRPLVRAFAKAGITANAVTAFTCVLSVGLGIALCYRQELFYLLPPFLFVRMALNAIDGMLAKEFGQKSRLGAFLNELTDVVNDMICYVPLWFVPGVHRGSLVIFLLLIFLAEFSGLLGQAVSGKRRYEGPMGGKTDRATWMGLFAALCAFKPGALAYSPPFFWLVSVFVLLTAINRLRLTVVEAAPKGA